MADIILFGNEKGGVGKTTLAIHTIISLLRLGFKVACLDLDIYQQSLTCYLNNRKKTKENEKLELLLPEIFTLPSKIINDNAIKQESYLKQLLESLISYDFVILDTPGSANSLSRFAHIYADKVVTPINDSFVDLQLIGVVDKTFKMTSPGIYSAMFFQQKIKKAQLYSKKIDWVLLRNRLATIDAKNKKNIEIAIANISKRLGFKVVHGFHDRVIFKELFLTGLTLNDIFLYKEFKITPSILSARQEMRNLLLSLNLKGINQLLSHK